MLHVATWGNLLFTYKILIILVPVIIALLGSIVIDDHISIIKNMNKTSGIILIGISLLIITILSIYSSQKQWKYFISLFFISNGIGHGLVLLLLLLFEKIFVPNDLSLIPSTLFIVGKYGAIPSMTISVGLLTRRKPTISNKGKYPRKGN